MKFLATVLAAILVVIGVTLSLGCVAQNISVYNDINAWLVRAQVAADVETMTAHLDRAEQGLEDRNMDSGHSGLVVQNSENDFAEIRRNIDNIQLRADQLSSTPVEERGRDAAYQQGLDDLRGTLNDLDVPARGYYWRHGTGLAIVIGMSIVWPLAIVFALIAGFLIYEDS